MSHHHHHHASILPAALRLVLLCLAIGIALLDPVTVQGEPVQSQCLVTVSSSRVWLSNAYVRLSFNLAAPQVDILQGRFTGSGEWGANLLVGSDGAAADSLLLQRGGIVLERVDSLQQLWPTTAASSASTARPAVVVTSNTTQQATVVLSGVLDSSTFTVVNSTWTLSLTSESRTVQLQVSARATRSTTLAGVRLSVYASPVATYGLFDDGTMATMGGSANNLFATNTNTSKLLRSYFCGQGRPGASGSGCLDVDHDKDVLVQSVLMTGTVPMDFFRSGVQGVLVGGMPATGSWVPDWRFAPLVAVSQGDTWTTSLKLTPNDRNFPAAGIPIPIGMSVDDIQALVAGSYVSAAGGLLTHVMPGRISSTILHPQRTSYKHEYTFYDPDTFLSISALVYSGDPALQLEARRLIEASMFAMQGGRIPHNFVNNTPVFHAISGANQTGPNLFWLDAALVYVANTGDTAWLQRSLTNMTAALGYLTAMYKPSHNLLLAPGPLWIDTLIRTNFSSDSNTYMVRVLRKMADAHLMLGGAENRATAKQYLTMADNIAAAINARLWDATSNDHYITQLNPDNSTRDFVDYDSNLLAVGLGVAPPDRWSRVLARVDGGECTHVAPTFVSERFYGPSDCYLGNDGDSVVAMGRIAWADALARGRVRDVAGLDKYVIEPLSQAILQRTWGYERFACEPSRGVWGQPAHSPFFIEYGEVLAMVLREVRYGLRIGFTTVTVDPLLATPASSSFVYTAGDQVRLAYNATNVCIQLPVSGPKTWIVTGLHPNALYTPSPACQGDDSGGGGSGGGSGVRSSSEGVLTLSCVFSPAQPLCISLQD